jgi:cell division protein FtsI (penicillin-binding protein 3)
VVLEGTGKPAKLDGYSDGGKSGTAQKIDPATGRYSRTNYVASFAGFAPVNEPAVAILVALDSPVGAHHGGEVAGPVFKRVAGQVLAYLNVPHDLPMPEETQVAAHKSKGLKSNREAMARQTPEVDPNSTYAAAQSVPAPTVELDSNGGVLVPSFAGASVRSVTESCSQLGLTPFLIGNGVAVEQSPEAGSRLPLGGRITVRFGRIASLVPAAIRTEGH